MNSKINKTTLKFSVPFFCSAKSYTKKLQKSLIGKIPVTTVFHQRENSFKTSIFSREIRNYSPFELILSKHCVKIKLNKN